MLSIKKLAAAAATFVLAAALPFSASACLEPSPFEDVPYSDFHFSPIGYCYYNNLMKGVTPERFEPETPVSRAMAVTTLYRADVLNPAGKDSGFFHAGEGVFSDVPSGSWYAEPVNWAQAAGLVSGVGGGRFAPHQGITRQDLAVILYRRADEPYKDWEDPPTTIEELSDYGDIAPYARLAVEWAYGENYLSAQGEGEERKLLPQAPVTRANLAAALMKATYDVLTPLHFDKDLVESIEITSLLTSKTVTITDPERLSQLVEQFNGYQAKGVSFPREEELGIYRSYRVRVNEAISQPGTTTFYMDPSGCAVNMAVYGLNALYSDPDQLPAPGDGGKNIFEEYFPELSVTELFALIEPENVENVTIRSGSVGKDAAVTNPEQIETLVEMLHAFEVDHSYIPDPVLECFAYSVSIDLSLADGSKATIGFLTNTADSVEFFIGSTANTTRYVAKDPNALPREFFDEFFPSLPGQDTPPCACDN